MTDIATAYVRLRPNSAGFQKEAESQVKGALGGLKTAAAFAIGAAGIGEGVKSIIEAAAGKQSALVQAQTTVKNAGAAWKVYGKTVAEVLDEQENRTGFDFEELAQGFGRLEQQIKNTPKALDVLGTAEDVARARHLQLAQVTVALGRAYAGNAQSLSRLGIVIPKYTANLDGVKEKEAQVAHALTAQSEARQKNYQGTINLTSAEKALAALSPIQLKNLQDQLKAQEAAATAADKKASADQAIAEVSKRYAGQADAFTRTAAGSYAQFRVALQQVEEEIGTAALPQLTALAKGGAAIALQLSKSSEAASVAHAVVGDLTGGVEALVTAFKAAEPVLRVVGETAQAIGVGPILAAIAAYKALTLVQAVAATSQARFDSLAEIGAQRQAVRVAALAKEAEAQRVATAQTEAAAAAREAEITLIQEENLWLSRETAERMVNVDALIAQTDALVANTGATELNVAAQGELAAASTAAGAGIERAAVAEGLQAAETGASKFSLAAEGLLTKLTGPTGIVAAVALLAGGLYYLTTLESDTSVAVKNLTGDLEAQTTAAKAASEARAAAQADTNQIPGLRDERAKAVDALRIAQEKYDIAATSGHASRATLTQDLRDQAVAEAHLRDVNHQLVAAIADRRDKQREATQADKDGVTALREAARAAVNLISPAAGTRPGTRANSALGIEAQASAIAQANSSIREAYRKLNQEADDASRKLTNDQRARLRALADQIQALGRRPTQAEVDVILNLTTAEDQLAGFKGSLIAAGLKPNGGLAALPERGARGDHATTIVQPNTDKTSQLKKTAKDDASTYSTAFIQTIDASGIAQALTDAIGQARSQVESQASSLASSIGDVLDARLKRSESTLDAQAKAVQDRITAREAAATARSTSQASNDAATKLKELQDVLGTGALTADQQLSLQAAKNAVLDAQDAIATAKDQTQVDSIAARKTALEQQEELEKTAANRRISDLTSELNRGLITQAAYVKGVRGLLDKEQVNYKDAGKLLGTAFADGFADSLKGVIDQAKALGLVGATTLKGKPTSPTAVNPLKEQAKAAQSVVDQIAGSGGRFNLTGVDKLPPGVTVSSLLAAAGAQRSETAYRQKQGAQADQTIHYVGLTADHTKAILDELKKANAKPPVVVSDGSKAKAKHAQATR